MSETRSGSDLPREVPLAELLDRLAERGTDLAATRFLMARTELAQDLEVRFRRIALVAGAMLLVVFGLQFLVVSGFLALATVLAGWLAALVVSAAALIAGAALLLAARSWVSAPFLKKTLEALREDLRWIRTLLK
ncbi:MAG: phage holin family protein [Holophagales bacterium]|nr:phage holin family protein [Holophagales bacterium]